MTTVNVHEAKTHLSRLIDRAAETGEPFVIAKAGRPVVRVVPIAPEAGAPSRTGFLAGEADIPESFDRLGEADIEQMFHPGA